MDLDKYKELDNWAFNAVRSVILNPNNVEELDKQKTKYNLMTRKQKREADWASQSFTGEDNETRYNRLKNNLSKVNIEPDKDIEYDGSDTKQAETYTVTEMVDDDSTAYDKIRYPYENIEKAHAYALDAMRVIIYPTYNMDRLDDLYIKYKSQIRKHQREADWKAIELFGIDNETHYKFLKNIYSKQDFSDSFATREEVKRSEESEQDSTYINTPVVPNVIESKINYLRNNTNIDSDTDFIMEACKDLQSSKDMYNFYENRIVSSYIDDTIKHFKDNIAQVTDEPYIPYIDMPFYDPKELLDLGIFNKDSNLFSVEADNKYVFENMTTREWFDTYRMHYAGFNTPDMEAINQVRVKKLLELYNDIECIMDDNELKARKQSILELGWNPNIPFTPENRVKADNRINAKLEVINGISTIIDAKYIVEGIYTNESNNTTKVIDKKSILYPVYIVLVEGKRIFSNITKKFTHSRISHAAIGFDPKLDKLYSFNAGDFVLSEKTKTGGLSIEDVSKYTKDKVLEVYTIFLKEQDYKKIRKMVDSFIDKRDEFSYSFLNILTLVFNIPMNRKTKMICSQFVDRILKLCNIDITHKDSSMVTPADFELASYRNKKIYKLYDGKVGDYDYPKVSNAIEKMINKVEPIKEMASILESIMNSFNAEVLYEAKSFPVQFDKDGNLLIKNMKKLDYGREFSSTHKLLKQYQDTKNYDGMKYELAKLWFMNMSIEDKVHSNNSKELSTAEGTEELIKHRAHILGDFTKYLKIIIANDKEFNFSKYYDDTPFSDAFIKVNSSTLHFTIKTLKDIFKHI